MSKKSTRMKPNEDTASICGLFCGVCPSYPEECHGCLSDKLTADCVSCPNGFRSCAQKHQVVRCYECEEFPCERLEDFSGKHWEKGVCHHATVMEDLQLMKDVSVTFWLEKKIYENTCPTCGTLIHWMDKNTHKCPQRMRRL